MGAPQSPPAHTGRGTRRLVRRVLVTIGGAGLCLVGIALLVLPGPGLLLALAGLTLLAGEYPWARRLVAPVQRRALQAAEQSVASWPRLAGSTLCGLALLGAGVAAIVVRSWPLGGVGGGSGLIVSGLALLALLVYSRRRFAVRKREQAPQGMLSMTSSDEEQIMSEKAILAGGCFWGMQDLIRRRRGIVSTRVGYTGGDTPNATYRDHGSHAEAIEITFDPEQTSYRDILEFFFRIHDPTTKNRQGNDIGTSYRSAIFYLDDEQKRIALDTIADVDASGRWPGKVVTEVAAAGPFWEAEPEHQDYLERYPNGYTCHYVRPEWTLDR